MVARSVCPSRKCSRSSDHRVPAGVGKNVPAVTGSAAGTCCRVNASRGASPAGVRRQERGTSAVSDSSSGRKARCRDSSTRRVSGRTCRRVGASSRNGVAQVEARAQTACIRPRASNATTR